MITSKRLAVALLLTVFLDSSLPAVEVKRPRILGVAHMALFVSDLQKARAFYKDFLGYEEPSEIFVDCAAIQLAQPR